MNITEDQHRFLEEEAEKTGLSISEILRRALDMYFENLNKERHCK